MTMLTRIRAARSSGLATRWTTGPTFARRSAAAHLATIKRFFLGVLTILVAGTAVAAIMALKIAIYLPRFHY